MKKPVFRTVEQKQEIVEAYFSRGDRPGKEVAAELGVPAQLIYNWRHQFTKGETPSTSKKKQPLPAKVSRALDRARQVIGAAQIEKQAAPAPVPRQEYLFEERPAPITLELIQLKQERDQLKEELARVKRALSAMLADH